MQTFSTHYAYKVNHYDRRAVHFKETKITEGNVRQNPSESLFSSVHIGIEKSSNSFQLLRSNQSIPSDLVVLLKRGLSLNK